MPPSLAASVPLIIVSPSHSRRELPESLLNQIKPEAIVDAHHSQSDSDAASDTRATLSPLEAATVTTAVAERRTDDSPVVSPALLIVDIDGDNSAMTRSSGYARSTGATVVQVEKSNSQYLPDVTFVVISRCEVVF